MIARREMMALGAAGLVAIGMPVALLTPGHTAPAPQHAAPTQPQAPTAPAPLTAVFERPLFAPAAAEPAPKDAPALAGIVGRLDLDAVAMVRGTDGSIRSLRIGESADGWTLQSLAIDAAYFTRGSERVRVALPSVDDAPPQ